MIDPSQPFVVHHDPDERKFTAVVDEQEARIDYSATSDALDFHHTYVPNELRGRGVGTELVKLALDIVRGLGQRVVPTCPFVRRVIEAYPEYGDLVSQRR